MNPYRIIRPLGEGATGKVFLAEDAGAARKVALKFVPFDEGGFLRDEVSVLSRLSHPNLVKIYGYDASGTEPFFAMEFVDGPPIDAASRRLDAAGVLNLFVQVARGLRYLHARGVLHRDLKSSNILVSRDGEAKILDFGLASVTSAARAVPREAGLSGVDSAAVGTADTMAPEVLGGVYDAQSDLYSLGAVFREISAERTDLPGYFTDLLERLTQSEPAKRPASALTLIRYLNRHAESPYEIEEAESFERILQKTPWVPRDEEPAFWKTINSFLESAEPAVIRLTGPTGSGRTRFLEEAGWRLRLDGVAYDEDAFPDGGGPSVVVFKDLHEKSPRRLEELELFLRRVLRRRRPIVAVLEYDADLVSADLKKLLAYEATWERRAEVVLSDLSLEKARELLQKATADFPLEKKRADEIVAASGGRPLLLLEALRGPSASGDAPTSLKESCHARVGALEDSARRLLALVVAHPEPVASAQASKVFGGSEGALREARLDLQRKDFLKPSEFSHGLLELSHPSLREAYRKALPAALLASLNQGWRNVLETGNPQGKSALLLTEHALAAGETESAQKWGVAALEHHSREGRIAEALELSERLLERAQTDWQRLVLHAHRAPLFYRLGRYEDALEAYDLWFALKPDDGTGVEKVKHRLYTGMVLHMRNRSRKDGREARERLEDALRSADGTRHAAHRPYLARAHALLASLDEREKNLDAAGRHLEKALTWAEGSPLLLGEIENQHGLLLQSLGRPEDALERFRRSAVHYRDAGRPQAEAIAHNAIAVMEREQGRLHRALAEANAAVSLAEQGGEILQHALHRANRALIFMDLALYGEALRDLDASEDALEQYGSEQDREKAAAQRNLLNRLLGHSKKTEGFGETLADAFAWKRFEGWRKARALSSGGAAIVSKSDLMGLLASLRAVEAPEARWDGYRLLSAACARRGLKHLSRRFERAAKDELKNIHRTLPEELKMDFEKNRDLEDIDRALGEARASAPAAPAPDAVPRARFRQFCEINRRIALGQDVSEVLERVLDAALDVTGAERGVLLLKKEGTDGGKLADYEVRASRHMSRGALEGDALKLSFTAVLEAVQKGEAVLTDDAQLDPRFRKKQSVVAHGLKSILVAPLEHEGDPIGAVYLDHRYRPGCFSEESVLFLTALSAQASLVIQKARLISELETAKKSLEGRVDEQSQKIEILSEELTKKREQLRYGYEEMVGRSKGILKVFELLDHVSETAIPVWILGESGTGKELVARSLHVNSPRKNGPFVAENVSAIPETLLESELFGHKKGSFTHADRDRVGLFEQASGGTLFLDEIADMSLAMQAKLLRVLQEGEVRPVGSSKKVKVDVRLVSASNRDLARMVKDGKFRQDLFFRINGLTIKLPPLRERKEDIPLLADHFLKKISKEFGLASAELTEDGLQVLLRHHWSGNIRELEAALRNALLFAKGRPIDRKLLLAQEDLSRSQESSAASSPHSVETESSAPEESEEREMIVQALRRANMDKKIAAKELGISLRTLYSRMDWHRIPKKKTVLAKHVGLK
ncbi:MAG TPA: sigma 54-interacting transcriptional regulator [bacterium]|nr:sigma 54-interacting transcriptional regulator [bacterium]